MASSAERRAVAKALLGDPMVTAIPRTRDGFEGMTYHEAAYRFWDMCRRVRSVAKVDIALSTTSVLADLIDPTCHMGPAHAGGFGCDRCYTWFPDMKAKTSYCPHCGARVVSADGE